MIALDTNILARLLLRDDEDQYRKAVLLFSDGREYTVPPTVILELVWVLGGYGHNRADICASVKSLLGLPNFKPKQGVAIALALLWYESGMDFGDALHLALSNGDEAFATFDTRLAKRAERAGVGLTIELM